MSDRSYMLVDFDDNLPAEVVQRIYLIVADDEIDGEELDEVRTDGRIEVEEARIGDDDDVHNALLKLVDEGFTDDAGVHHDVADFAWSVQQDPKYNYDGTVHKHTPGLADFHGIVNGEGKVVLPQSTIDEIVNTTTTRDELVQQLTLAFGKHHKH